MRKDVPQQMRLPTGQHAQRRFVARRIVDRDEIDCVGRVELVNLEPTVDDRNVPVEEVDELRLAVGEHGLERECVCARRMVLDGQDHGLLPVMVPGRKQFRIVRISARNSGWSAVPQLVEREFAREEHRGDQLGAIARVE